MRPGTPEVIGFAVLFLTAVIGVITAGVRQDARINRQLAMEYAAFQRDRRDRALVQGPGVVVVRVMDDTTRRAAIEAPPAEGRTTREGGRNGGPGVAA